jgi:seryl-tRNA synthetase
MLARELLRNHPEEVRDRLATRGVEPELFNTWEELDTERRESLVKMEELKRQRNEASKAIGKIKQEGGDATAQIEEVGRLKGRIAEIEERVKDVTADLSDLELRIPNLPHESVPIGTDEEANRIERVVGEIPSFDFAPQAHWDLGPELGILDFERGAKITGARFTTYFGAGAHLERALINFFLDLHTREHGYTEVLPPFVVSRESLVGSGQLPKFEDDLFKLEEHEYFMAPTAEVPLTNIHRGETLDGADLPLRYVAYTPCFRAEAGSHGRDVRGLIRQHQFNKVELYQFAHPDKSYEALEELTACAEKCLQLLELPYRTVCLATGDMGFSAAKTYDLEVWLPGQAAYREISSCSNCEDFQARRANIRFKSEEGEKAQYLHTLNGSGLAVGRTLVAILENYQQADGTVVVPDVLQRYMGTNRIVPR